MFREIFKCQISWKSVHWEPRCSMRTDGRRDVIKLIVAFSSFANVPKINGEVEDEEYAIRPCYVFEGFDECIQNCPKKTWKWSVRRPRCRWGDVLNLVQPGCKDMIPVSTVRGKWMQSCRWCVVCPKSNHCSDVTIKLHTQKFICLLFRMNNEKILQTEKHDVAGV
jgi:hypothetical protein